jgi:rfaE bifunctional protein kinase chain/domain
MIMKVVFVTGRFNVLHPGHVRLLRFARECGDWLVVGVEPDAVAGSHAHVPEALRLEGVRSCAFVDEAFILDCSPVETIRQRRPSVVVKGREHEGRPNPELLALEEYGGKLLFSSGEVEFSSLDLIKREFSGELRSVGILPKGFMARHGISVDRLGELVTLFAKRRLLVVGDVIVDEYVSCDPLGMSQEDPTLVVRPIDTKRFIGGAAIVAAHAATLGAESTLVSVVGDDSEAGFALEESRRFGVHSAFTHDDTRPTTLKTRFRCEGKTLLRVSRLQQGHISTALREALTNAALEALDDADVMIFSDFNYGVLSNTIIESLSDRCASRGIVRSADSQSSSQIGDIGKFKNMDLLTPTEREARISTRNTDDGLTVLAEQLRNATSAKNVFLKLGAEGALVCPELSDRQPWPPDRIEALNPAPKDVAGAGDSMLVAASLALASGANIWEAACLGSIAAAIQVGRVGNTPVSAREMMKFISEG